jgi:hypothetical protein
MKKTTFKSGLLPGSLNNQERFELISQRHKKAFQWEDQGWIPLGLIVNDPRSSEAISYDDWLKPEPFLKFQAKVLHDTLEVGSDINPTIAINHMGNALIPSLFGAEITVPTDQVKATAAEIGPWIFPALKNIKNVDKISAPKIPSNLVSESEKIMKYYQDNLPKWVKVVSPSKIGSFSIAELLRGSEFYLNLAKDIDRCKRLMNLCTESVIEVEKYLRAVVGQNDSEFYSEYGIAGLGLRLGDDSIMNISPDMIGKIVVPELEKIADAFGGKVYVHFCSLDNSRSEHVYDALLDVPFIFAVSSQFGFEYYERNINRIKNKLAIETMYGDGIKYIMDRYGSFEKWATEFVPKYKHISGLILYFEVDSVVKGKELWDVWQKAHCL